jgi:Sulfotransferase family
MKPASLEHRFWSFVNSAPFLRSTRRGVGANVYKKLNTVRRYAISFYKSRKDPMLFRDIKTYCMFVGYARSGHSIIGALLDAHPNVILPDEVDVLRYISAGFSRDQIYHILLARSQRQANKGRTKAGRNGKRYSYFVPSQWQGRFNTLQVIGDSKAGISTQRLAQNPEMLQYLQHMMKGIETKFIFAIRNPYDNISTMSIRGGRSLDHVIERYFANCATIVDIRKRIDSADMFVVKHEEFLDRPEAWLNDICRFLGVEASDDYLQACAGILYKSPAKSRHSVEWSPEQIDAVRRKIDKFDFLEGYAYDD